MTVVTAPRGDLVVVFSEITALEKAVGNSLKAPVRSGRGVRCAPRFASLGCGACVTRLPGADGPFQSRPPRLAGEPTRVGLKGATRSTYETTQAPQRSEERSESQESNASGLSRCSPLLQLTHH